ncbi:hypothetical protein AZ047_000339 [Klebsiella pneumoniae]|nr:hypothetical protein AZ047_000339 [Klebsiella pneumoniae]
MLPDCGNVFSLVFGISQSVMPITFKRDIAARVNAYGPA